MAKEAKVTSYMRLTGKMLEGRAYCFFDFAIAIGGAENCAIYRLRLSHKTRKWTIRSRRPTDHTLEKLNQLSMLGFGWTAVEWLRRQLREKLIETIEPREMAQIMQAMMIARSKDR